MQSRELLDPVLLCDWRGRLNPAAVGWSRHPLHRSNLRGAWPRKKRWNYWAITTERHLFSVTLSHIDYMGLAFAYYLDFETKSFIEQTVMTPFGQRFALPETVEGELRFQDPALSVLMKDEPGQTRLAVTTRGFKQEPLVAEFAIDRPADHETLNVVVPWSERRFQYTSKQEALPARGSVRLGNETISFDGGFATLDFGRGIWPYKGFWNWAAGSGVQNGRTVGLNLGGGWTDGTGQNENGFVVDGRLTKVHADLRFEYDPKEFMRPWRIRTKGSDQVDLEFHPFFERVAKTDALILFSEVHQMIGRFQGQIVTEAGERLEIKDLVGWAEEHKARW